MRKLNIGVAARLALVLALSAGMCTWTIPLSVFADEPAESHEANMVASNQDKTGEAAEKPEATETTPIPDELGTIDSQDPSPIDEAASTADARNDAIPPETIVQPAEDTVGFTYIESSSLTSGDTQNIAIALSDEKTVLSSATITISHDGNIQTLPSSAISGNAAKFTMESVSSGKYTLKSFAYSLGADDATHVVDLAPHGLSFDVDSQASDDGADTTVYEIDSSGTLAESKEMTDEVNKATDTSPLSTRQQSRLGIARPKLLAVAATRTDFSSHPVVCIDAGHGGDDSGALGHGLQEKDLNLKIANYCKTALEQKGVRVVMTRTGDTCPSLAERTKIAVNAGANYFVSIHINSAEDAPSANGCEVWVPNDSSYRSDVRASGEVLGKEIDQKLAALGLRDRGIKTRDSSERTYSDGHAADYYAVIRQGRQAGIPSVIVEHAFITNSSDAKKLSNDSWLKQLGKADAAGILSALSNDKRPAGQSGWFKDGGAWYYMDPSGAMRTGWLKDGGTWYYMDPSGAMRTGWLKYGGAWYYLDASGAMRTGTSTIDGVRYTFNSDGSLAEDKTTDYAIMGDSATSVNEMVRLYKSSGASYPSNVYKNKGAASIEEFCQIVYEEARAEGVRAEVVFCQEMNETNWLRFGGDVKAEQCNFAGLGATGNGVSGNTFPDVRTGIRAQVQHLKAYASTEPLKNKCVDTRFGYVSRGSAPTVLKLSGTWAASKSYGQDLLKLIDELQSIS